MKRLGNDKTPTPATGRIPLRYRINPCDIDHYEAFTPMQRFFEFFSAGTDCKCCLGARVFFALTAGGIVGFVIGRLAG